MEIEQFAEHYKVRAKRDECGDPIAPGRGYSNIFDGYADGRLGVCLMFASARKWGSVRRRMQAAGFTVKQDGDTEGICSFDPADHKQARLAIKMAGVRTKKRMAPPSPAQLAVRERFALRRKAAAVLA